MKNITIWSVGGWKNYNYGDCVLQEATTREVFSSAKNYNIRFVYVDAQKTYFSRQLINKMNIEADMLLLAGGGFIMHRSQDNSKSGWQFNIETKDINKISIPIVVNAIGYNHFPNDKYIIPSQTWENIQKIIDKSEIFTVRNYGTLDVLKKHVDVKKVQVSPDFGMFVAAESFNNKIFDNNKLKIGLNWATDRAKKRFGSIAGSRQKMESVLRVCGKVANEYNAQIYVIEHLIPNELNVDTKHMLYKKTKDILKHKAYVVSAVCRDLYPPLDYYAGFFADVYKKMDLVIGMRGHANIIPFGQNVPMVGIGQHNKVKWFLDDVERGKYLVKLDKGGDEAVLEQLVVEVIENMEYHKKTMLEKYKKLSKIKDNLLKQIKDLL